MPDVNVKGRYRIYTHDGIEPLPFTSYATSLCSIRRPNPNTFITISTYIPGSLSPFTTFDPGSSYTIVTKSNTANFSMGPYTRADRLPSSVTFRSPNFYHGLDKNSITVALSSYALSVNSPLSTAFTYIPNQDGYFVNSISFNTQRLKEGLPSLLTHLTPNSSYQFINRTPFTFFAPLQSEMGDAYAIGDNNSGEYGMGHWYTSPAGSPDSLYSYGLSVIAEQTFGIWDKIVTSNSYAPVTASGQIFNATSFAALSTCGNSKAIFVLGNNSWGQLGTGNDRQYYATWTKIPGVWKDVELGSSHMLAINPSDHLYACGRNTFGQLGLGSGTLSANTLTLVDDSRNYVELAPGGSSTAVRDSLGRIWVCGNNLNGQLGLNNTTTPIYTLTQEATNSTWTKVRGSRYGYMVALKENKLFGCGYNSYYFGSGSSEQKNIFTQEILGLTDIIDFYISARGTYIKRIGQGSLFASGYNGISSRSYLSFFPASATQVNYFIKTNIPRDITKIISTSTGTVGYIWYNRFYAKAAPRVFTIFSNFNVYEVFPEMSNTFFMIKDGNIRPTPTPTPVPPPTPPPTPLPILQVGIFGGSFPYVNSQIQTSQQNFAYNSPGNLNNVFALNNPNAGFIPPGKISSSTFDYEKGNFNNIVGIGVYTGNGQGLPANRYNPRYIYKKIGSSWTYTLLPADMDARSFLSPSDRYSYTHGCDTLLITPERPGYSNTSQGVYNLIFVRDRQFKEAISYDRGVTWNISGFRDQLNEYADDAGINKVLYSRSRESNYSVRAAMVASNRSQLIFAQRFPDFNFPEIIFNDYTLGLGSIQGFNFTHDYNNIPTVVFSLILSSATGAIALIRKINGSWQTVIVKQNIAYLCIGPEVFNYTDMGRINSPTIGLEVDPTNSNLIYIAYLRSAGFSPNFDQAVYINVLCYNMATNSVVFDESVVRATRAQGSVPPSIHTVDSIIADVPTLFYDKTNNSLNLFFVGQAVVSPFIITNYIMSRINGSWSAPTSFTTGTRLSNNNELRVKY